MREKSAQRVSKKEHLDHGAGRHDRALAALHLEAGAGLVLLEAFEGAERARGRGGGSGHILQLRHDDAAVGAAGLDRRQPQPIAPALDPAVGLLGRLPLGHGLGGCDLLLVARVLQVRRVAEADRPALVHLPGRHGGGGRAGSGARLQAPARDRTSHAAGAMETGHNVYTEPPEQRPPPRPADRVHDGYVNTFSTSSLPPPLL